MPPFCAVQTSHAVRSGGVGARSTVLTVAEPSLEGQSTWTCQILGAAAVVHSVQPHGQADVVR
eukprot:3668451-Prymnesium_polylepis.1